MAKEKQELTNEQKDALTALIIGGGLGVAGWVFLLAPFLKMLYPNLSYPLGLILFTLLIIGITMGKTTEARAKKNIAYGKQKEENEQK